MMKWVSPEDIVSISPCPFRIRIDIEEKLNRIEEAYMGSPLICKIIMEDDQEYIFEGNWNIRPLISPPPGYNVWQIKDVVSVSNDEYIRITKMHPILGNPEFQLCMYSNPEKRKKSKKN